MSFKKGEKKPEGSGRKKGTPNKRTQEAIALSEKLGVDPLEVLLLIAKGDWKALGYESSVIEKPIKDGGTIMQDRIELDHRLAAAKESCKYIYPARKAIEFKDEKGKDIPVFNISLEKPKG